MRLQCAFCLTNVCTAQNATHKSQNDGDNQTRHTGANAHTKAHLILRVCVSSISISQANWQLPQCNWKSARFPLTRHQSERRAEKVDNKNDYNSNITRINNSAACWTNTYNLCTYCSCFCCGGVPHYALPSQRQIAHNYKIQWKLIYHARNIYGHAFNINFHFVFLGSRDLRCWKLFCTAHCSV